MDSQVSPAYRYAITNRLRLKFLEKWLPQMKGIGCNFGAGASDWSSLIPAQAKMWRMDIDLAEGKKAEFLGDIRQAGVRTESLDWILCSEVAEHVFDFKSAFEEIRRSLKPGGKLILTVPFSVPLHGEPHDYWRFTAHSLRALASETGFKVIDLEAVGNFRAFYWQTLALEYHRRFAWVPEGLPSFKRLILQLIQTSVPMFLAFCYAMASVGNSSKDQSGHVLSWGTCLEKI